uniref:Uncharacterized protein n=1 Tax=Acropora millepora TaxID=45264 RepID=G8HT96_ACRMI|nr:hypothetical protein C002-G4 [Acropora millepora]
MKIFFIASLIVALVWQTHARSMGPLDEIVKEAGMVKENLDPKKLGENVQMVEKEMEKEVKEGEQKIEKIEEEAEGKLKNNLDPKKLGENVQMVEKDMEKDVKEGEQELEKVEEEAEGKLKSAIKMEQEAAKKAGAMIGSSLKRRSDKKSESEERSSKEHPEADPLKKLKFFLQFFLSNVMGQLAKIGRNISG